MGEPANKLPDEDRPDLPGLRAMEEDGGESGGGAHEPSTDDGVGGGASKSLYTPGDSAAGGFSKVKGQLTKLSGNKLLVGGAIGGSGFLIGMILLLLLAIGPYKIVSLAEQMSAYQFARVTRDVATNSEAVTSEKMGIDIADKNLREKIIARYTSASEKTKATFEKFDKYRPNKVIGNFENSGKLKFNYEDTKFSSRLTSVTINGAKTDLIRGSARNLIPGYNFVSGGNAARTFAPDLITSLKAEGIGPITRGRIARQVRQKLGISLTAWIIGKYAPKPGATSAEIADAANAAEERMTADVGDGHGPNYTPPEYIEDPANPKSLEEAAQKAKAAEIADVHSETGIKAIVKDPNRLTAGYRRIVGKAVQSSALSTTQDVIRAVLKRLAGIINPIYNVAVPVCLVYEGSIEKAQPSIDAQSNQVERNALQTQIEASQQKDGSNVNLTAVEAGSWKHGDPSKSIAYNRAAGERINTTNYSSTQSSPFGQYSRSLSDLLPSPLDTLTEKVAKTCPYITNLWVGLGLGAVNIAVSIFSGGSADVVEGGGAVALDAAVEVAVPSLAKRVIGKLVTGGNFTKDFGLTVGKQVTAIGAATFLSQQLIMSKSGATHSSLAVGPSYTDDNDSGLNIHARKLEQQINYGAPLPDSELQSDNKANRAFLTFKEAQKSPYDRYLALDNPNSLLMHVGMMASTHIDRSVFTSLFNFVGNLLSPAKSGTGLLFNTLSATGFADTPITSVNTYYGNVQFGYTAEEIQLRRGEDYKPFANREKLDASGQEATIESTYIECFDGTRSMGSMLQEGMIERDSKGSVIPTKGKCSQSRLGPHNSQYGDLVFRWRLAKAYENTIDQLNDEQVNL